MFEKILTFSKHEIYHLSDVHKETQGLLSGRSRLYAGSTTSASSRGAGFAHTAAASPHRRIVDVEVL